MDSIKISVDEIKYYVNEKKRCVTCHMTFRTQANDFIEAVSWQVRGVDMFHWGRTNEAIGQAYASPHDVFDVEQGKRVARARAESAAYVMAKEQVHKMVDKMKYNLGVMLDFSDKAYEVIGHNKEYIKKF